MQPVLLPDNEVARLEALHRYQILDTAREEAFDDLARLAAFICGTPIALVSLVDANRVWFKSKLGLDALEVPRNLAFCSTAILQPDVLLVEDTSTDQRFADNPLVTSDPGLRFYAGTPLITPDGHALGTICTLDRVPRTLTPEQVEALRALGKQVLAQFEMHRQLVELEHLTGELKKTEKQLRLSQERFELAVRGSNDGIWDWNVETNEIYFSPRWKQMLGYQDFEVPNHLNEWVKRVHRDDYVRVVDTLGAHFSGQTPYYEAEYRMLHKDGTYRWFLSRAISQRDQEQKPYRISGSHSDISDRKQAEAALRAEQETAERLLLNVLPAPIAQRLKQEPGIIADHFPEATVLFADLVGFTQLSTQLPPKRLVELLNRVFSAFDKLAERHGVEKIKTIGDGYMVVGGLPTPHPNHAQAIADMALDMQAVMAQLQRNGQQFLSIRMGIHTGPVVAGVIGIKKFSYDLWGDTVNLASRMEFHSLTGSIQMTEATYQLLQDQYECQPRGEIEVKGIGKMKTYFLTGKQAAIAKN